MSNKAQKLKGLQTRQSKLNAKLQQIKAEEKDLFKRKKVVVNQLKIISKEIKDLKDKKPMVTEHAVVQFLVRTGRIKLEDIQKEIMGDKACTVVSTIKNGRIPITSNLNAVVKDYNIVSVIPKT
jgi:parvulin-like peptidyl-prolyl isomerase